MVIELYKWLQSPEPKTFPYEAVLGEYRRVGKHFVHDGTLRELASIRDGLSDRCDADADADAAMLRRFLETALDKWDGRYDYPTYTALCVLPLPTVDEWRKDEAGARRQRDRIVVQLAADALAFELAAIDGHAQQLPGMRPALSCVHKRCRLALRVATPPLVRLGLPHNVAAEDPEPAARELCQAVQARLTPIERRMLALSMLPVYVLHDEYLFIRVLQMFEATFAMLGVQISGAVRALDQDDWPTAASHLRVAESALHESAPLFSLLGTMQVEAFRIFRQFTDDASAIQSRNYKLMESLCRKPDRERLESAAYTSTPEVRTRVIAGSRTLDEAVESATSSGRLPAAHRDEVANAMSSYSATLRRWRQTHYRLAVRMLGEDTTGTGHTEGTGYLRAVRSIDIFRSVSCGPEANDEAA